MRVISYILTGCIMVLLTGQSFGQESKAVSEEEFRGLSEQIDYSDTKRSLTLKEMPQPGKKERKERASGAPSWLTGIGGLFNLLAYVLIAVIFCAAIYLIFGSIEIEQKLPQQTITEADLEKEHIDELDLEKALNTALENGDYRQATRMRFLILLQYLSLNNHIDWRFEKTNRDYANELRGSAFYQNFRKLSGMFEWVWYGNEEISKEAFEHYRNLFDEISISKN